MNIKIIRISRHILEEIIKELGTQSITRCIPYLEDGHLYFCIFLIGFNISTDGSEVTFYKNDKKVTIKQLNFSCVVLLWGINHDQSKHWSKTKRTW